jgi:hypothetical protein
LAASWADFTRWFTACVTAESMGVCGRGVARGGTGRGGGGGSLVSSSGSSTGAGASTVGGGGGGVVAAGCWVVGACWLGTVDDAPVDVDVVVSSAALA